MLYPVEPDWYPELVFEPINIRGLRGILFDYNGLFNYLFNSSISNVSVNTSHNYSSVNYDLFLNLTSEIYPTAALKCPFYFIIF
jgi:hypothetical protein